MWHGCGRQSATSTNASYACRTYLTIIYCLPPYDFTGILPRRGDALKVALRQRGLAASGEWGIMAARFKASVLQEHGMRPALNGDVADQVC